MATTKTLKAVELKYTEEDNSVSYLHPITEANLVATEDIVVETVTKYSAGTVQSVLVIMAQEIENLKKEIENLKK